MVHAPLYVCRGYAFIHSLDTHQRTPPAQERKRPTIDPRPGPTATATDPAQDLRCCCCCCCCCCYCCCYCCCWLPVLLPVLLAAGAAALPCSQYVLLLLTKYSSLRSNSTRLRVCWRGVCWQCAPCHHLARVCWSTTSTSTW